VILRPGLLLICTLGCDPGPSPETTSPPGSEATEAPGPETTEQGTRQDVFQSGSATPGLEVIRELQPVLPTRLARVPMRMASTERIEQARGVLSGLIETHGREAKRPAVLVHSLLALGPEIQTTDGRSAIDALFEDWAIATQSQGAFWLSFPRRSGEVIVEAHRGIVLKTLTEIGVPPDRAIRVDGKDFQVADLYRSALAYTWVSTSGTATPSPTFSSPRDLAWTLQGLSSWSSPEGLSWQTLDGHEQTLDDFAIFNFVVLHVDSQPVFLAQTGDAALEKYRLENGKKVGVGPYQHSCGAAHALQASGYAAARGHGSTPKVRQGLQGHVANMFWRLGKELAMTDELLARPDLTEREVSWLLVQQLKSTGHFLESMSKLSALGYYSPDPSQQAVLQGAMSRMVDAILKLEERGTVALLPSFLDSDSQLFMDLVNDSAHALNGLELALGERVVMY
jgi:hypothetical protein